MFCGFVFLMAMVAARLQLPHLCVLSLPLHWIQLQYVLTTQAGMLEATDCMLQPDSAPLQRPALNSGLLSCHLP